jgi:hypothetical protein
MPDSCSDKSDEKNITAWHEKKERLLTTGQLGRIMFFGLCPMSNVSKNTYQKLDLFPSSDKMMGAPTLLGPLEKSSLNH